MVASPQVAATGIFYEGSLVMPVISKNEDGGNGYVEHALELAARGLSVFPLRPKSKMPWPSSHGHLDATTDAETIAAWWHGWPDSNIGVATGARSGIFVVDIDGDRGEQSLIEITNRLGALPATVEVLTGNAGRHLYFKLPTFEGAPTIRNTASAVAAGIDTRGEGGYVVAPPSAAPKWCALQVVDELGQGNRRRTRVAARTDYGTAVRCVTRRPPRPHTLEPHHPGRCSGRRAQSDGGESGRQAAARRHPPPGHIHIAVRLERIRVSAAASRSRY